MVQKIGNFHHLRVKLKFFTKSVFWNRPLIVCVLLSESKMSVRGLKKNCEKKKFS